MSELDEVVASWDLGAAGEVVVKCSDSTALGAQYSYRALLRGDDSFEKAQEQLDRAGFGDPLAGADYGRVDLELVADGRHWRAAATLQQDEPDGTICGDQRAEIGDTVVSIGTTTEDVR